MVITKKTKLAVAYSFLVAVAGTVVAVDGLERRSAVKQAPAVWKENVVASPYPMTRLADSVFLKGEAKDSLPLATLAAQEDTHQQRGRHVAPFGIYYLRMAVHADSEEGPITFGPGTQVRLLRRQEGKMRVTRNGVDFLVDEEQMTNDLDAVATLARSSS